MAPIASAVTRVLVTGFGPFSGIPDNPSWGIASRLPSTLPNNIELIVHPAYVPVSYGPVIDLVPKLVATHQPDLSLHIGVAEGRKYFAVEQTSQKYGYQWSAGVDGKSWSVQDSDRVWAGQPDVLATDLNLQTVLNAWQERTTDVKWPPELSQGASSDSELALFAANSSVEVKILEDVMDTQDVRWTDSVGTYLCGFIYYTGMVEMSKNGKNKKRDVAFMHVPYLNTEELLGVGVDITTELIQSLVQTWREQRGG